LLQNPVGVEKLFFKKIGGNNFALRFDLSDVLEIPRHFACPNFALFGLQREFFNSHSRFHSKWHFATQSV